LLNYYENKFKLWENHKFSPSEIEKLPFYEYQMLIDSINKKAETENAKDQGGEWVDLKDWGKQKLPNI